MHLNEFNNIYLSKLLDIISKENKTVYSNIDLLKFEKHHPTSEFLDSLSSNMFLPSTLRPTRIHSQSRTFINNIFFNLGRVA